MLGFFPLANAKSFERDDGMYHFFGEQLDGRQ